MIENASCGSCLFFNPSDKTCRFAPAVRLPRKFASDATAGNRVRDETVFWGWPVVLENDWCGHWSVNSLQIANSVEPLEFIYTNHRGETKTRRASPCGIRYGTSDYYSKKQWLMNAFDIDKQAYREFAIGTDGARSSGC